MRKFNIIVNGKSYQVEVEEIKAGSEGVSVPTVSAPTVQAAPPSKAPAPKPPKATTPKAHTPPPAGADTVKAPMPGTILDIKVEQGASVAQGQVVMVLEAMKMENEIMAPRQGSVASLNVSVGASVNAGDVLMSINRPTAVITVQERRKNK